MIEISYLREREKVIFLPKEVQVAIKDFVLENTPEGLKIFQVQPFCKYGFIKLR